MYFEYGTCEMWWIMPLICIGIFVLFWILFGYRFCGMRHDRHKEKRTEIEELKKEIENLREEIQKLKK